MIVLDASAAIEMLLDTETGSNLATSLSGRSLHAPHVIDLEVVNVLRRLTISLEMTANQADQALEAFLSIPITRYPVTELIPQIWALRHNLTAYDAAYLALARSLGAELVTMDAGLRKSARRRER